MNTTDQTQSDSCKRPIPKIYLLGAISMAAVFVFLLTPYGTVIQGDISEYLNSVYDRTMARIQAQ